MNKGNETNVAARSILAYIEHFQPIFTQFYLFINAFVQIQSTMIKYYFPERNYMLLGYKQYFLFSIFSRRCINVCMSVCLPIIDLAGTAFHSSQNVMNDDVTRMMPGMKKVVK